MSKDVITKAATQTARHANWVARRQELTRQGDDSMRHAAFPEPTGDQIIEAHVGDDGAEWARLADLAIEMANDKTFRERAGRPEVDT